MGGKVLMLREDCLAGVDAVMMVHPNWRSCRDTGSTAINRVNVEYFGKAAHAAGSPEQGINALDAVIMLFNSVSFWRQQLPESSRIHGIIGVAACAPISSRTTPAATSFCARRKTRFSEQMNLRFADMIEAAAKMSGCGYKSSPRHSPTRRASPTSP